MSVPEDGRRRRHRPPAEPALPERSAVSGDLPAAEGSGEVSVEGITVAEEVSAASDASLAVSLPGSDASLAVSLPAAMLPPAVVTSSSLGVAAVSAESSLPGAHRGGFARWPTAPIEVGDAVVSGDTPEAVPPAQWAPAAQGAPPPSRASYRGIAAWALGFAIVALCVSTFVGWGFPIGILAVISAIVAYRRPIESRTMATWALVLGIVSLVYSAGWLWFAASRTDLLG